MKKFRWVGGGWGVEGWRSVGRISAGKGADRDPKPSGKRHRRPNVQRDRRFFFLMVYLFPPVEVQPAYGLRLLSPSCRPFYCLAGDGIQ